MEAIEKTDYMDFLMDVAGTSEESRNLHTLSYIHLATLTRDQLERNTLCCTCKDQLSSVTISSTSRCKTQSISRSLACNTVHDLGPLGGQGRQTRP